MRFFDFFYLIIAGAESLSHNFNLMKEKRVGQGRARVPLQASIFAVAALRLRGRQLYPGVFNGAAGLSTTLLRCLIECRVGLKRTKGREGRE